MKITEFMVVIVAALLFLIPTMRKGDSSFDRQLQEEAPIEEMLEESNTLRVTYEVNESQEESIGDILWMKKAAEMAKDQGVPFFNVLEQKVIKKKDRETGREYSVIDGVIELDADPMRAEFDAQEIESLVLTEAP